jgi:hypothetical protein
MEIRRLVQPLPTRRRCTSTAPGFAGVSPDELGRASPANLSLLVCGAMGRLHRRLPPALCFLYQIMVVSRDEPRRGLNKGPVWGHTIFFFLFQYHDILGLAAHLRSLYFKLWFYQIMYK